VLAISQAVNSMAFPLYCNHEQIVAITKGANRRVVAKKLFCLYLKRE